MAVHVIAMAFTTVDAADNYSVAVPSSATTAGMTSAAVTCRAILDRSHPGRSPATVGDRAAARLL
jgi:hypothetical protein